MIFAIHTSPRRGGPIAALPRVFAWEGRGLQGDRYLDAANRLGEDGQATFVEWEMIRRFQEETGIAMEDWQTRRNFLTRETALNPLVGRRFQVGQAVFEGLEPCEPCETLRSSIHPQALRWFTGRGGLRCRILRSGWVQLEDPIQELGPLEVPAFLEDLGGGLFRRPAYPDEETTLADLRADAMESSLRAIGRFDPQRARARLLADYRVGTLRVVEWRGQRAGFYDLRPVGSGVHLSHLYLDPKLQGRGLGSRILQVLLEENSSHGFTLAALRGSRSNEFYRAHGFELQSVEEFDNHYRHVRSRPEPPDQGTSLQQRNPTDS